MGATSASRCVRVCRADGLQVDLQPARGVVVQGPNHGTAA